MKNVVKKFNGSVCVTISNNWFFNINIWRFGDEMRVSNKDGFTHGEWYGQYRIKYRRWALIIHKY